VLLSDFEAELSAADVSSWNDALQSTPVFVSLPKFEMRSSASLNEALEMLGIEEAFIPGTADFGRKVEPGVSVHISSVIHEAYVKVDEKGTEAAAATGIEASVTSVPDYPYFEATRPFLFQIQDRLTGSVLFMGRVVDPTEKAD
jgi:serpin B